MIPRATTAALAAFLLLSPATGHADLSSYSENFESLVQADPQALGNAGWLVFGNVWDPTHTAYLYGYGVFPAPNGTPGFCSVAAGQGGIPQGAQQLVVYSDYNNADHGVGNQIEANVFKEQTIGAVDVGSTWVFRFEAKRGDLVPPTAAVAFIKTLDPNNGYATTNFITLDMASIPATWSAHLIPINISAGLVGQILQFGFNSTTSNYSASGVFYDNLQFQRETIVSSKPSTWGNVKKLYR